MKSVGGLCRRISEGCLKGEAVTKSARQLRRQIIITRELSHGEVLYCSAKGVQPLSKYSQHAANWHISMHTVTEASFRKKSRSVGMHTLCLCTLMPV